jgi:hypothetical protein
VAHSAAYLAAILLPLVAAFGIAQIWVAKPLPRRLAATVHRSDRSRQ